VALGIPSHQDDSSGFATAACDVIEQGYVAELDMALVTTSEVGG